MLQVVFAIDTAGCPGDTYPAAAVAQAVLRILTMCAHRHVQWAYSFFASGSGVDDTRGTGTHPPGARRQRRALMALDPDTFAAFEAQLHAVWTAGGDALAVTAAAGEAARRRREHICAALGGVLSDFDWLAASASASAAAAHDSTTNMSIVWLDTAPDTGAARPAVQAVRAVLEHSFRGTVVAFTDVLNGTLLDLHNLLTLIFLAAVQ
jgi:hypothetical protein